MNWEYEDFFSFSYEKIIFFKEKKQSRVLFTQEGSEIIAKKTSLYFPMKPQIYARIYRFLANSKDSKKWI